MAELYFPPNPTIGDTRLEDNGRTYFYQSPGVWTIQFDNSGSGDWVPINGGSFKGTVGWVDSNSYTNVTIKTDGSVDVGSNNTGIKGNITITSGDDVVSTDKFIQAIASTNEVFSVQADGEVNVGAQPAGSAKNASIILEPASSVVDVHGAFTRSGASTNGLYSFISFDVASDADANFAVGLDGSISIAPTGTDSRQTPSVKVNSSGQIDLNATGKGIKFPDGTIQITAGQSNVATPNLQEVTTAGATTTEEITVGALTSSGTSTLQGDVSVTANVIVSGTGNKFSGDGSGLTNLPIGEMFHFLGPANVTTTAPSVTGFTGGETYLNDTAGTANSSWTGIAGSVVSLNQFLVWSATAPGGAKWVTGSIIDTTSYVTINTAQDITATKTFTTTQKFTKSVTIDQDCTVGAGYYYNGDGSKLTGITSSQINNGVGLENLSAGNYLVSSTGNPYDGENATTFNVNAATDATVDTIVARDGSGNIQANSAAFLSSIGVTTQQVLYSDSTQNTASRKILMTAASNGSIINMYGDSTTETIILDATSGNATFNGTLKSKGEIETSTFDTSDNVKVKLGVSQNSLKYAFLVDDTTDDTEYASVTTDGFAAFAGTVTSRSTVTNDGGTICTTKDYVDNLLSGSGFWNDLDGNISPVNTVISVAVGDSAAPGVLLTAAGAGTFLGTVTAASAIIANNSTIGGTLGVTGTTTTDAAIITNNATVGGTLGVTGSSTLAAATIDAATITNNATVGGTFGVTGVSTLAATTLASATITAAATVGGTLEVTGATTISANVDIDNGGSLTVAGNETVTGTVQAGSLTDGTITKTMTDVLSGSTADNLQEITDNGATTTNTITAGGYSFASLATLP